MRSGLYEEFLKNSEIEDYSVYLDRADELLVRMANEPHFYKRELLANFIKDVCSLDYESAFDAGYNLALEHVKEDHK